MTGGMGWFQAVNSDCSMKNDPDADVGNSNDNDLHHCGVSVVVLSVSVRVHNDLECIKERERSTRNNCCLDEKRLL
jgi:hypothetical protein